MKEVHENGIFSIERNINFTAFVNQTLRHWYVVVLSVLLGIILGFGYNVLFNTPSYISTAKIYVIKESPNGVSASDFNIASYLSKDFTEIMLDESVLKKVQKEINNQYSVAELSGFVKIDQPEETRIIEIIASTPDAENSKKIVDAIARISQEEISNIMDNYQVNIIREGNVPKKAASTELKMCIIIGAILGIMVAFSLILVMVIFNFKITSKYEIENHLELDVLTSIPHNSSMSSK